MIHDSVLELIGRTPLVRLGRLPRAGSAEVVAKLERTNPAGSVKDRIALAMIEAAERDGTLVAGNTIVEPTSGNTGLGLALVAAVRGYRLILTMPDDIPEERLALLGHYGAEIVLTPARKMMAGAIDKAKEIVADNPGCFTPSQFANPANPQAHRDTTAAEILKDVDGPVDAFVAGIGTGGTITGVGAVLREANPLLTVVAVEPTRSAMLAGCKKPESHAIVGIGAGFIPEILERKQIDRLASCTEHDAFETSRDLARREGISAGPSGGAAVWVALQVAAELGEGKRVVVLIPDGWDRYVNLHESNAALDFII